MLFAVEATVEARSYRPDQVPNVQLSDRTRYTSNPDRILSDAAVVQLDSICRSLREAGLAQVAVVAVESIGDDDVFNFAIRLFRSWGVGNSRNNNGLGVLLVKDQREIRFVTGGGLEGVLPDAICKRIQLQFMLPAFREGDYDGGMTAGLAAVASVLVDGAEALPEEEDDLPGWAILLLSALILGLPLGAVAMAYRQQHRCPQCGKLALKVANVKMLSGGVRFSTFRYTYRCKKCGYETTRTARVVHQHTNGSGPFIGGGGFGGGSSGGSFGGGSFGGGGAGSRW